MLQRSGGCRRTDPVFPFPLGLVFLRWCRCARVPGGPIELISPCLFVCSTGVPLLDCPLALQVSGADCRSSLRSGFCVVCRAVVIASCAHREGVAWPAPP